MAGERLIAAALAGVIIGGAVSSHVNIDAMSPGNNVISRSADGGPTPTPSPTATPRIMEASPIPGTGACPDVETSLSLTKDLGNIAVTGIPDNTGNVDVAKGAFTNTIGLGTEAFLAEPGGNLIGLTSNQADLVAMNNSDGHINAFDAETHEIARGCPPIFQLLPTNGLVLLAGQEMEVEVGHSDDNGKWVSDGKKFELKEIQNHQWLFVIKGFSADATVQGQDKNRILRITKYVPGAFELKMYKAGKNNNTPFMSEGGFLQVVADAHNGQTNCGTGCRGVGFVGYEINTGAVTWDEQTMNRNGDPKQGWTQKFKNW